MEIADKVEFKGKRSLKPTIDVEGVTAYNKQPDTVSIRNLVDANVKITGTVTGNVYIFNGAGSIRDDIDVRDKDEILNKKRGRSCCGGQSGKSLFELV